MLIDCVKRAVILVAAIGGGVYLALNNKNVTDFNDSLKNAINAENVVKETYAKAVKIVTNPKSTSDEIHSAVRKLNLDIEAAINAERRVDLASKKFNALSKEGEKASDRKNIFVDEYMPHAIFLDFYEKLIEYHPSEAKQYRSLADDFIYRQSHRFEDLSS